MFAASATPAHSSIFDQDDREYVSLVEGSPYSPVGVVTHGVLLYTFTTGFLVDDCHVLTSPAAFGYGQALLGKRAKFQAGFGTPQFASTKGTVVAAGPYGRDRTMKERYERGGGRWVLLRLDQCLGARLGHVALKTGPFSPYEFRDLKSAGYPARRSRKNGITIDPSCRIISGMGTIWNDDCATLKGDAGDPIFRISGSGTKSQIEVYAMQAYGFTPGVPVPLTAGLENQAIPMSLIAPQIEPYLSANGQRRAGESNKLGSQRADAVPHIGPGVGAPSNRPLLDTSLGETNR
ncbi:trypsin-like serine peptidase [Sphingomonas sp.]|uniref:trypsin-like serine peptidase n=1 Tax=Sphingomonas sp. TaxID=28214 RepID=UPI0038A43466